VAERHATVERVWDAVGAKDLLGQRRGILGLAPDDRDVLGRVAVVADQPRDVGRDLLDLRALAAGLERHDRVV
jgi:hypothetical protein